MPGRDHCRAEGTKVAVVDTNGAVHYRAVTVGRDFGTEVEILKNVREGDRLVTNPAADLIEGTAVIAKELSKPPAPAPMNPMPKS